MLSYTTVYIYKRFTQKKTVYIYKYANETNAIYQSYNCHRGSLHVRTEQIMPREEIIQVNVKHRQGPVWQPCVQVQWKEPGRQKEKV